MSIERSLGVLRVLCTSGVDLLTQMPLTSQRLKQALPAFSLSLIRVDDHCAPREHYSEFFDEFSHQLFASAGHHFSARSDDPAAFGNLLRNANPVGALVDTRPEYVAGATYQHLFQRNGIHHTLDLALRDARGPLGILGMFREEAARPFSRREVEIAERLYPWLVHALAAPRGLGRFEELDTAMLVVRRDGHIESASRRAQRWLEDTAAGDDRARLMKDRRLPEACRALFRAVDDVSRPRAASDEAVPTVCLPMAGGRLRLRAYALGEGRERIGVHLSFEVNQTVRVLQVLAGTDLSPQLQRVALLFWQGDDAAAVAAKLGLSPETMKSYRKELYTRLDVNDLDGLRGTLDARARDVTLDFERHQPLPSGG
jgi:hypothetical protein